METEILAELRLLREEVAALRRENREMRELIEIRVPQGTPDCVVPDDDEMWWEEEGGEPSAVREARIPSPPSSEECGWSTDSGSLATGKAAGVVCGWGSYCHRGRRRMYVSLVLPRGTQATVFVKDVSRGEVVSGVRD